MKEGKLFGKISVIDAAVLVFLLLLATVLVARCIWYPTAEDTAPNEDGDQPILIEGENYEKVKCLITVYFKNISGDMLDAPFAEGDTLLNGTKALGKITKVTRTPHTVTVAREDGSAVTAEKGNAYDYYIEVPVELYRKDNALRMYNNTVIAVGRTVTFGTEYYYGKGTVTGVEKIQ